jgi:galactokinase
MKSITVKAPGRINLIGEHIDYNHGFVLPAAINKSAIVTISKRSDQQIHLTAIDIPDELIIESFSDLVIQEKKWANYIVGVIAQFQKKHSFEVGFNLAITSDVPIGAGLSSSAAIECAVAYGLNELFKLGVDKMELAFMAQKAEHEFAGVQCGIMDQFASIFGKSDQVVLLDCASMEFEYFPLILTDYQIVLFDTGVKHALANSEYNTRKFECEKGLQLIQQQNPHIKSFREVSITILEACIDQTKNSNIYKRCKYVIEEIHRTIEATKNLKQNDLKSFGEKMFATHEGLSLLYEVSCPELDILVNAVKDNTNVLGARMMGGGFGGCTINIIKSEFVEQIIIDTTVQYKEKTGKKFQHYLVSIENGVHVL